MFLQAPIAVLVAFVGISCFLGGEEVQAAPQMPYGYMPQQGPYASAYMPPQGPYMPYMQPGGYPYPYGPNSPEEAPESEDTKPAEEEGGYHAKHTFSALNGQFLNDLHFKFGK